MAALAFWSLHLIALFAGVLYWGLSWRVGVTILTCVVMDFFLVIWMTVPSPAWHQLVFLVAFGASLGFPLALGRRRHSAWHLPAVSGTTLLAFQGLLVLGRLARGPVPELWSLLLRQTILVLGIPVGLLAGAALAHVARFSVSYVARLIAHRRDQRA